MGRWYRAAAAGGVCLLILASAVVGLGLLASMRPKPQKREIEERVYNVQVFEVETTNLTEIVHSFGTAKADLEVVVPAQVAGEIVELHDNLRIGLHLKAEAADKLAVIDKRTYTERRDRAQNLLSEIDTEIARLKREQVNNTRLLEKAKGDLKTIQEQYDRVLKNKARGAASASDVTRALLEVRQYEQTILQLENEAELIPVRLQASARKQQSLTADLKLAEIDLDNTTVVAPFDGSVSEVMVEKGQYVRLGDPLIRLTNTKMVEVPLPLPMSEFLKIERALQANRQPDVELAVNETAPTKWRGRLVRAAPEADASTRTVMTYVEVENEPKNAKSNSNPTGSDPVTLRPGSFVHARIDGPTHNDAIVIPRDAIIDGKVFIERHGKALQAKVTVDRTLHSLALIADGLQPGDKVVLTNLDVLIDGAKLKTSGTTRLSEELQQQRIPAARIIASE